uniref:Uncharacterized protein n=1 Tax=Lepeophtheirus salmonis TaxID=72036 RepID=A0A0K2T488_LEPSM
MAFALLNSKALITSMLTLCEPIVVEEVRRITLAASARYVAASARYVASSLKILYIEQSNQEF